MPPKRNPGSNRRKETKGSKKPTGNEKGPVRTSMSTSKKISGSKNKSDPAVSSTGGVKANKKSVPSVSKPKKPAWNIPPLPKEGDPRIGFSRINPRKLLLSVENPRTDFTSPKERKSIEALADSIVEHDIIEPIIITPIEFVPPEIIKLSREYTRTHIPLLKTEEATHIIVAGERRFRAVTWALFGYEEKHGETIPCAVRVFETESARLAVMFAENMHRSDVNPIDRAKHLRKIYDALCEENPNTTQTELSRITGTDQSQISQLLRLLDLPDELQKRVYRRELSPPNAIQLAEIRDGRVRRSILGAKDNRKVNASQLSLLIKSKKAEQDHDDALSQGEIKKPVGRPPESAGQKLWKDRPISCICAACTEKTCRHHPFNVYLE